MSDFTEFIWNPDKDKPVHKNLYDIIKHMLQPERIRKLKNEGRYKPLEDLKRDKKEYKELQKAIDNYKPKKPIKMPMPKDRLYRVAKKDAATNIKKEKSNAKT